jgi:hypothetical protein
LDIVTALAGITSEIILVKNSSGDVYVPDPFFGIDEIGQMQPGQGYKIKMLNAATQIYPANTVRISNTAFAPPGATTRFVVDRNTGNNATIIIPDGTIDGLDIGDEIGVFNSQGHLAGSAVYDGRNLAITAWGQDALAPTDREFLNGELFKYKVWKPLLNRELELEVSYSQGEPLFRTDGISVVEKGTISGLDELNPLTGDEIKLELYPIPAREILNINVTLAKKSEVVIQLYDIAGKVLSETLNYQLESGQSTIQLDLRIFPSGQYFYKLSTEDQSINGGFIKVE